MRRDWPGRFRWKGWGAAREGLEELLPRYLPWLSSKTLAGGTPLSDLCSQYSILNYYWQNTKKAWRPWLVDTRVAERAWLVMTRTSLPSAIWICSFLEIYLPDVVGHTGWEILGVVSLNCYFLKLCSLHSLFLFHSCSVSFPGLPLHFPSPSLLHFGGWNCGS